MKKISILVFSVLLAVGCSLTSFALQNTEETEYTPGKDTKTKPAATSKAAPATLVYVTNSGNNTISVIDPAKS